MFTSIIALLLLALVNATQIHVDVGKGGALKFDPEVITASDGDVVMFHFYTGSGPHSVVNGKFDKPCTYDEEDKKFWSENTQGDKDGNETFHVGIGHDGPIWFYCSVGHHCQQGMVGVINPPADKGLTQYRSTAATVGNSTFPSGRGYTTSVGPPSGGNSTTAPGNGTSTGTGNNTSTSTRSGTATTNKPTGTGPASSSSAAPSSTSSGMAAAYTITPETGSVLVGLVGLIGAAFI